MNTARFYLVRTTGLLGVSVVPVFAQVPPFWAHVLDQRDLLRSPPALDLLLPRNGIASVAALFVVDQVPDPVLGRERRSKALLVLVDPTGQVICHPGVERARTIGHNIDEVALRHSGHSPQVVIPSEAQRSRGITRLHKLISTRTSEIPRRQVLRLVQCELLGITRAARLRPTSSAVLLSPTFPLLLAPFVLPDRAIGQVHVLANES